MALTTSIEIYIIIGGVVVLGAIVLTIWCCRRRKRRSPYSLLEKKAKRLEARKPSGVTYKDEKLWIGGQNIERVKQQRMQQRKLQTADERYLVAVRFAGNYCKNLRHSRYIVDELPSIGHRDHKFFHVVNDDGFAKTYNTPDLAVLMAHYALKGTPAVTNPEGYLDFQNKKQRKALRTILTSLQSPYVMPTYDVEFGKSIDDMFVLRKISVEGSLRDFICNHANLSDPYVAKYKNAGKPLSVQQIRVFGRQILEALEYFKQIGFPYYHLHSGNVVILDEKNCAVTDYENAFLGFSIRATVHRKIRRMMKKDSTLEPDVLSFGYVLFEMATGQESPTHEPPQLTTRSFQPIQEILERIFYDRRPCSIRELIQSTFFGNVNGIRMGDMSAFNELKTGDTPANQLVREKLQAINQTFVDKYVPKIVVEEPEKHEKEGRKKKKKSRRRKEKEKIKTDDAQNPKPGPESRGTSIQEELIDKPEKKRKKKKKKKEDNASPDEDLSDSESMFGEPPTSKKSRGAFSSRRTSGGLFDDLDDEKSGPADESSGSDSEMFGGSDGGGGGGGVGGGGGDYFDMDDNVDVDDILSEVGLSSKKDKSRKPPPPPLDAFQTVEVESPAQKNIFADD